MSKRTSKSGSSSQPNKRSAASGSKMGRAEDAPIADAPPRGPLSRDDLLRRVRDLNLSLPVELRRLEVAIETIRRLPAVALERLPEDLRETMPALKPQSKRFHGAKVSLNWFPSPLAASSPCANTFGYLSSIAVRNGTKLPFNAVTQGLLNQLGDLMGDPGREAGIPDSTVPSGYTYVGQFVDHDITLDVSSTLNAATDATTILNMRTPLMDLDSLYGHGPALEPYLYAFPTTGDPSAIKFQMGTNQASMAGGPAGNGGNPLQMGVASSMLIKSDFDVPRTKASNTAIIGDPRNDENLIVSQFHQTMLRFHNQVVDLLLLASFVGDVFAEAKRIVTHHYQWAIVNDFLKLRVCGAAPVAAAMAGVSAPVGSQFRMPVEFSVAAYRFGHTMIRDQYWLSFAQPTASLGQVFSFIRNPMIPVLSNWVVDFNAFFTTGVLVPVNNKGRAIDSVLASGLETLPGFTGLMAVLAKRNLRRGLALGLPSGQGMATSFGFTPLTAAQLTQGLPPNELALLNANGGLLLQRTPLWYYCLREAAVLSGGNLLGPVGAKIVADTFVRMLKRDGGSYLNLSGGFTPFLPSATVGDFTFADLVVFAGVTQP